jgi:hypothetical protein
MQEPTAALWQAGNMGGIPHPPSSTRACHARRDMIPYASSSQYPPTVVDGERNATIIGMVVYTIRRYT